MKKININHLLAGIIVLAVGISLTFGIFDNPYGEGGSIAVVVGLIYLLLGFGLRPTNRFTSFSALCIYTSILNYAVVYFMNTQQELELGAVALLSPTFVLLPLSPLLLIVGIILPLFKKGVASQ